MAGGVEVEVVLAQFGDMHQTFHEDIVERHEHAETDYRGNDAIKLFS